MTNEVLLIYAKATQQDFPVLLLTTLTDVS